MKLHYGNIMTRVECKDSDERKILESLLVVKDPHAQRYDSYQNGEWDGYRRYLYGVKEDLFPSGLIAAVLDHFKQHDISCEVYGRNVDFDLDVSITKDYLDGITLRPYQMYAVETAVRRERGVIRIPPRGGKTEVEIAVAKAVNEKSLLLVNTIKLLRQTHRRFKERGLKSGRLGGGYREIDRRHVVATVQTVNRLLDRNDKVTKRFLKNIQVIQADECHHLSAPSWFNIFLRCDAPYRLGYSGTPYRLPGTNEYDHRDYLLMGACGPYIINVDPRFLKDEGYLADPIMYFVRVSKPSLWKMGRTSWHTLYKLGITENRNRNSKICDLTQMLSGHQYRTLIIVQQVKHGKELLERLKDIGIRCALSFGGERVVSSCGRVRDVDTLMGMFESGKIPVMIGSPVYDEGVDIPYLDAVIIASGGKSNIKVVQRAYRGMTAMIGKRTPILVDFDDQTHYALTNHSKIRRKEYKREGIRIRNAPEDFEAVFE